MEQFVSISKIKREIYNIRKEIADIKGEYPQKEKKYNIYLWKGVRIEGHSTKLLTNILLTGSEDYTPIPDSKYIMLLIRNDLLREKQILTRELIDKITKFRNDKPRFSDI